MIPDGLAKFDRRANSYDRAVAEFKRIEKNEPWYDFPADGNS